MMEGNNALQEVKKKNDTVKHFSDCLCAHGQRLRDLTWTGTAHCRQGFKSVNGKGPHTCFCALSFSFCRGLGSNCDDDEGVFFESLTVSPIP